MITVHLGGEDWAVVPSRVDKEFKNADMSDQKVKEAFKRFIDAGLTNVNCVMEDSQSPDGSSARYTHPYVYNHNGDVDRFVYDDSHAQAHMEAYQHIH